ncbi:MAG: c-type cytochrome [Ginsengibacter sp.]
MAIIIAGEIFIGCRDLHTKEKSPELQTNTQNRDTLWRGKDTTQISTDSDSGKLIMYGYRLIVHTARYLGPKGVIAHISNGMNCENCHLEGGTKPFANNFAEVYSTYPKYIARNNSIQNIYGRINECLERSLNGQPLDTSSREMQAMYAYMKWLGEGVSKDNPPKGAVIPKLKYMSRAADPVAGKQVFEIYCQSCHGANGEGVMNLNGIGYTFPPLWGKHSFNDGAGFYRLGNFAEFVKNDMPLGTTYQHPVLSDQQAWDVAAFVNSEPRPHKNQSMDWKDIAKKPVDFPFGPYTDTFSQRQHKYGPFLPIKKDREKIK